MGKTSYYKNCGTNNLDNKIYINPDTQKLEELENVGCKYVWLK